MTPNQLSELRTLRTIVVVMTSVVFAFVTSVCIDMSRLIQDGVYLENNLYTVTTASSLLDCAADCSAHVDCLSFGFKFRSRSCHLHTENSRTTRSGLAPRANWLHGDIGIWPKAFWGPCTDHNCSSEERCKIHRAMHASVCVKVNPVLPSGYCPLPADILNARISPGPQHEGATRTYTCNHGYLDTVSEKNSSAGIICLGSGKWSSVSLNCTGPYIRLESPWLDIYTFTPISPDTFLKITGNGSSLIFLSKNCRDTDFSLHLQPNLNHATSYYEVIIGGWENTKSIIRDCRACQPLVIYLDTNILSCKEFRPFWLSWQNGTISVGKGRVPGDQAFMEWKTPISLKVTGIGISSYTLNSGTWLFSYH